MSKKSATFLIRVSTTAETGIIAKFGRGYFLQNNFVSLLRFGKSQYEAMTSLAQGVSQLLHHLLSAHGLAIHKRSLVLSGIFQLLGKSLLFAKRSSFVDESVSQPSEEIRSKVEKCNGIFEKAFLTLRGSLEETFSGDLFYKSESWRQEEFQVHKKCNMSPTLIGSSISQSFRQPISHSFTQSVSQSVSQVVGRSVSRSVSQSVSQSDSQLVGRWVSRSVGRSVGRSVRQSFRRQSELFTKRAS